MPADSPKPERPPRQQMPEREAKERGRNFDEVALGFTEELAVTEASRCLACKRPACVENYPVGVDIPGFLGLVKHKLPVELDDYQRKDGEKVHEGT